MNVNYEKEYTVYADINPSSPQEDNKESIEIENLIHESNRLQLNTYQAFVRNLMNPRSDLRSLLLIHMTGTGKTITALATATEYVNQYEPNSDYQSVKSVVVLGFTKDIFKKELLARSEFEFVNPDEAKDLQKLEEYSTESPHLAEEFANTKKKFHRRLFKKEVKGIYQFYGYRQFTNRIINMDDVRKMIQQYGNASEDTAEFDFTDFDPKMIKKWIQSGEVRINIDFIKSLSNSLFICDEVHNLYKSSSLNTYGIAIECVFEYYFNTLEPTDAQYGSVRSLLLSATPLTSSAMEIIPIINLLTGQIVSPSDIFQQINGIDQITTNGMVKIRQAVSGRVSYIMDDNPKEYPTSEFIGDSIKGIDFIKFIRCKPSGHQLKFFQNLKTILNDSESKDDKGNNMVKDIVMPGSKSSPHGVIFSRNIADLSSLSNDLAVHKVQNGTYTSNIFEQKKLKQFSCKYAELINMCIQKKDTSHGKIFIYHPFIQGSGTDLIISVLRANGFLLSGDVSRGDSICMKCNVSYGNHKNVKDHDFIPVCFTFVTGNMSKAAAASKLSAFNNPQNLYGEKIKIIVGSKAMRESHTLQACKNVIIVHEPSSISEMIQIIGRAVRKNVHAMLPAGMRSVQISILTTDVSSIPVAKETTTFNEELAYKTKILQYKQINHVERIMYEVSIDYLINFRFKTRETPPLIGDSFPLDDKAYKEYFKKISQDYSHIRNGTKTTSIATNRFNIFYFESEVKLVTMIIKRILLSYQPLIKVSQLKSLIRSPPFHVEYNTQLISNESIAVALSKLVFTVDQFSIREQVKSASVVDNLYDQSSSLRDLNGKEYKIICYGNTQCDDSIIVKQSTASLMEGSFHVMDIFKNVYQPIMESSIDLQGLAANWASTITVEEILEGVESKMGKESDLLSFLNTQAVEHHAKLAEWAIERVAEFLLKSKPLKKMQTVKYLIDYYETTNRLIYTVRELDYTKLYDKYKKLDVDTGASWFNKGSKYSTATMPICHVINNTIRVLQPSDFSWLEVNSIGFGLSKSHPYGFYMYEERLPDKLSIVLKIRYVNDEKAKGVNMLFLPKTDLEKVAKALKANLSGASLKPDMIDVIEKAAWATQKKLYPKRVIYRLLDL